ncbi:MAG: arginine deiminase family protein [Terricaulis sp.]
MSLFDFNRALVRAAPASVVDGLRAVDHGAPSLDGVRAEQAAYVAALEAAGAKVEMLPALEAFPDSIFVEDAALVFSGAAIVLRPGAPSRRGEAAAIAPELEARFARVLHLDQGTVDGGDVLTTPRGVFIGVSARTSAEGADALTRLLAEIGLEGRPVATPPGVLHFKSDCSMLDEETMFATPQLAASGVFEGFRVVPTPPGEEGAANLIRVGGQVLLSNTFPRAAALLDSLNYRLTALPTAEISKIDAGLSCMSLRWRD